MPTTNAPTPDAPTTNVLIRRARPADVRGIKAVVDPLVAQRVLVPKESVAYYEAIHEFVVAELPEAPGQIVGCGALHVMWEDLAEVRTLAVREQDLRKGVGAALLGALLDDARRLGISRVFCLTFETAFFESAGFDVIDGQAVTPEVYAELLRSYDEGVAEFLDLERVKPNTLGNTRMLLTLRP